MIKNIVLAVIGLVLWVQLGLDIVSVLIFGAFLWAIGLFIGSNNDPVEQELKDD